MRNDGVTWLARLVVCISALSLLLLYFLGPRSEGAAIAFVVTLLVLSVAALTG